MRRLRPLLLLSSRNPSILSTSMLVRIISHSAQASSTWAPTVWCALVCWLWQHQHQVGAVQLPDFRARHKDVWAQVLTKLMVTQLTAATPKLAWVPDVRTTALRWRMSCSCSTNVLSRLACARLKWTPLIKCRRRLVHGDQSTCWQTLGSVKSMLPERWLFHWHTPFHCTPPGPSTQKTHSLKALSSKRTLFSH
jgi:hypothetical protein